MNDINLPKYLSLKTAAESYGYTRDHLGLMIRKGKLQGIKLGNYYVTTNDWMVEYIKSFSDPNHPTFKNKLSNKILTKILTKEKIKTGLVLKKDTKTNNDKLNKNQNLKLSPKIDSKIDFEEEMSEELSKLSILERPMQTDKKFYEGSSDIEYPYVILPIREMKENERESILNRIVIKENKKNLV